MDKDEDGMGIMDEPSEPIERAVEEEVHESETNKYFYVLLALIVIAFASFFVYQKISTPTGATITVDELHDLNINGELSSEKGYTHNGFSFVLFDGLWYTKIQRGDVAYSIPLHFGPRDVKDVTVKGTLGKTFDEGDDVYITVNPLDENSDYTALAASELAQNMAIAIKRRPIGACDRNETVMCKDRSIVTCETTDKPMIYLVQEQGPEVEFKDQCIIVRGIQYDLVKSADRLLLQWYTIIQ